MVTPNFKPGVGRIAADRFDFQSHIDGSGFTHVSTGIKLDPVVTINSYLSTVTVDNFQSAIEELAIAVPQNASSSAKGVIKLSGDLSDSTGGTASSPKVTGLQGVAVSSTSPTTGYYLKYDGTEWVPSKVESLQGVAVSSTSPTNGYYLKYDGTEWVPSKVESLQGEPISTTAPVVNKYLKYTGTQWFPSYVDSLQGYPVSSVAPSPGNVFIYSGTEWYPEPLPKATNSIYGIIKFIGDLQQTAAPGEGKVVQITGDGVAPGNSTVTILADKFKFADVAPIKIYQENTSNPSGSDFYIKSQITDYPGGNGGDLFIYAGNTPFTNTNGKGGNVKIMPGIGGYGGNGRSGKITLDVFSTSEYSGVMFELVELIVSSGVRSRAAAFFASGGVTTSYLGSEVDGVIYIGDSPQLPTASPNSGALLYSNNGKLYTYQEDGYNFSLDSEPNPKIKIFEGTYSKTTAIKWSGTARTTDATSVDIFSYAIPDKSCIVITGTMIASYDSGSTPLVTEVYNVNAAWSCYSSSNTAARVSSIPSEFDSIGGGLNPDSPGSSVVSNNVIKITTGHKASTTIDWTLNIEIHVNSIL